MEREHDIDLLLIEKDGIKHYCLIKNLSNYYQSKLQKIKSQNIFVEDA